MNEFKEDDEVIKPLLRISSLGLVKYQKREPTQHQLNSDLFGNPIVKKAKKKYVRKGDGERKTILKEIKDVMDAEAAKQKRKPVDVRLFAIRLSHVPTSDLYFMLSEGKSYRHRTGKPFSKYIMGSVLVKKEKNEKNA